MSRQRKRQIILWYHGCAKYSKNTSNSSTLKLLQQSSLLITWPVLTKTNLVLWLKNGSVYKAYGQIKLSWWSGDSLISGSSSVRVTTKSLLRTSGRDWSWSGSWGTLQSGHWQDSLWDVQLGSEVLDTFVSHKFLVSISSCFGWSKSFLATTTPSAIVSISLFKAISYPGQYPWSTVLKHISRWFEWDIWVLHTLEEVLVDLFSVFLWNQHGELFLLTSNS